MSSSATASSPNPRDIVVYKVRYANETRIIRLTNHETLLSLVVATRKAFGLLPLSEVQRDAGLWGKFTYEDDARDNITMSSPEEFQFFNELLLKRQDAHRRSAYSHHDEPPIVMKLAYSPVSPVASLVSHPHITCDLCGMSPITGPRFKCTVRNDFDLCTGCEARLPEQPYPMVKIYAPTHLAVNRGRCPARWRCHPEVVATMAETAPSSAASPSPSATGAANPSPGPTAAHENGSESIHRTGCSDTTARAYGRRGRCPRRSAGVTSGTASDAPSSASTGAACASTRPDLVELIFGDGGLLPLVTNAALGLATTASTTASTSVDAQNEEGNGEGGEEVVASGTSMDMQRAIAESLKYLVSTAIATSTPPVVSSTASTAASSTTANARTSARDATEEAVRDSEEKCESRPPNRDAARTNNATTSSAATGAIGASTMGLSSWESVAVPVVRLLRDASLPDLTTLTAGAVATKTWVVCNDGPCAWPEGLVLVPCGGDALTAPQVSVAVPALRIGQECALSIDVTAPTREGRHIAYFRVQSADGRMALAQKLWIDIRVTPSSSATADTAANSSAAAITTATPTATANSAASTGSATWNATTTTPAATTTPTTTSTTTTTVVKESHEPGAFTSPAFKAATTAPTSAISASASGSPPSVTVQARTVSIDAPPPTLPATSSPALPIPAPIPQSPYERWASELEVLRSMGFADADAAVPLLERLVQVPMADGITSSLRPPQQRGRRFADALSAIVDALLQIE